MFKIVTTCYNCESFIKECIESVFDQKQSDWEMYIFDDASTDNSVEVANGDTRIKIIENKINRGAIYNKTYNFIRHAKPDDEDIIVTLDGDDYLGSQYALCYLKKIYSGGYWFSYGGFIASEKSFYDSAAPDHLTPIDWNRSLRNQRFCITALRSHKFFLLKNLRDKDLRYRSGMLFKFPEDIILNIPMAEMAGEDKCFFLKEKIYSYRIHKNSDSFQNDDHRTAITRDDLSFREEYPRKTKEELVKWKCDWDKKPIIIGLGTGRCGTVSLSKLLQKVGLYVTHELAPVVGWEGGKAKDRLNLIKNSNLDGDVAFWYLNLVEEMNEICENIRFVCFQRNIDEVVQSYIQKTIGRNHWMDHDDIDWHKDNTWDQCYPKYNVNNKLESIKLYCEEYHKRSLDLQKRMDNFKIFDVTSLNSESGIKSILNFLGINREITQDLINIRSNQSYGN